MQFPYPSFPLFFFALSPSNSAKGYTRALLAPSSGEKRQPPDITFPGLIKLYVIIFLHFISRDALTRETPRELRSRFGAGFCPVYHHHRHHHHHRQGIVGSLYPVSTATGKSSSVW